MQNCLLRAQKKECCCLPGHGEWGKGALKSEGQVDWGGGGIPEKRKQTLVQEMRKRQLQAKTAGTVCPCPLGIVPELHYGQERQGWHWSFAFN